MRKIFLICILLIEFSTSAQTQFFIQGRIIDSQTHTPLPYSNIFYPEKHLGTSADSNGDFNLYIPSADIADTIHISFSGYAELKLSIADCINKKVFGIQAIILDNVVVSAKPERFEVELFMEKVVLEYNAKRNKETHIAFSRYAETAVKDNKYIMYMESLGYTVITPILKNAAPLSNTHFICENTKCHVLDPIWQSYAKNLDKDPPHYVSPSQGMILRAFRMLELHFLSIDKIKKYRFRLDSVYSINDQYVYAIGFKGRGEKGVIHIFDSNFQILFVRYETNKYWSQPFHKELKADVELNFVYLEGVPYLTTGYSVYNAEGLIHFNQYELILQKTNKVEIDRELYWQLGNHPFILYNREAWENFESDLVSPFLNHWELPELNKSDFEDEFISASGKWFPSRFREIGGDQRKPSDWRSLISLFE